ncbi:type II secretion system protein [Sedimentisphaera salicampi]|uniref:type II secretion system protein n=1 Tax=Sedimentisphaera salicampi TaxID=1941349 RepID=UPI000B9B1AE4|nr:type II secretion system protein [Sedimentisphaera salicampi]OXU15210.1 putative major pilin subunit [Sedimentisphaera salicampi]
MKRKGFTLIELLVVIAIIAMLMAILMPALGRVRRMAQQLVCGTNLSGLGKACVLYANDNDEDYPIAGGKGDNSWTSQGYMNDWNQVDKNWTDDDEVTVSASLYLLIREADVSPKQFVCPSSNQFEFTGEKMDEGAGSNIVELTDIWDFGDGDGNLSSNSTESPRNCCSYAYHYPYQDAANYSFPLTASSKSGKAVLADRSPWYDNNLEEGSSPDNDNYITMIDELNLGQNPQDDDWSSITKWKREINNSNAHQREGQNVLYADGHTAFEKRPDVGIQNDNIYCAFDGGSPDEWDAVGRRIGADWSGKRLSPGENNIRVKSEEDNVLVNDIKEL